MHVLEYILLNVYDTVASGLEGLQTAAGRYCTDQSHACNTCNLFEQKRNAVQGFRAFLSFDPLHPNVSIGVQYCRIRRAVQVKSKTKTCE